MKVLFATTNPAKIKKYSEELQKRNVELITIKDLKINLKPEENGKDAIENAYIKAKAYYDATNITTIGMDNNLFIEELPEEKQPGTYVRRINGKELNDEEMIEYYTNLVKIYGKNGKLNTKWISGMVIIKNGEVSTHTEITSEYYLVDTPAKDRKEGYPLSSIMVHKKTNKYDIYLTEEDKKNNQTDDSGYINFIKETI